MKDSDWIILSELNKTRNITKAASRLYISQPALTKRLQAIENEFNIKIVERSFKGVEFTDEGLLLAARAEQYMRFLNQTREELRRQQGDAREIITVGAPYSFTRYGMSGILYEYSKNHPGIFFEIQNDSSNLLFRKACDGDVDVAFVRGDYEGNVQQGRIDEYYGYIMTKKAVDIKELPMMTRVGYRTNDRSQELMDRWWNETFGTEMPKGMGAGNYIDVAWELVSKGFGYCLCFLPDNYANPYNLALTPMLYSDGSPCVRNTWFVYREYKNMPKKLREFITYIEDNVVVEM